MANYYCSTTGSSSGDGSIGDPWDARTALTNTAHTVGDTTYARGGVYEGRYLYTLKAGTFRSYPGEWAEFDGKIESVILVGAIDDNDTALTFNTTEHFYSGMSMMMDDEVVQISSVNSPTTATVNRAWGGSDAVSHSDGITVYPIGAVFTANGTANDDGSLTFEHIEVYSSSLLRDQLDDQAARGYPYGFTVTGARDGTVIRRCVIHDVGLGAFCGSSTSNSRIYGNIMYNIGVYIWDPFFAESSPAGWGGQPVYLENVSGYSQTHDNFFAQSCSGIFLWGVSGSIVGGDVRRNFSINHGAIMGAIAEFSLDFRYFNLSFGTGAIQAPTGVVNSNWMYQPPGMIGQSNFILGYSAGIDTLDFNDNLSVGSKACVAIQNITTLNGNGNTSYQTEPYDWTVVFVDIATVPAGAYGNGAGNAYYGEDLEYAFKNTSSIPAFGDLAYFQSETGLDTASTATETAMPDRVVINPLTEDEGYAFGGAFLPSAPATFDIDLSEAALPDGSLYRVKNAMDYKAAAITSGTYDAGDPIITVDVADFNGVAAPTGLDYAIPTTSPYFTGFVIEPIGEAPVSTITAVSSGARFNSGVRFG
jgi:hypothetical protein